MKSRFISMVALLLALFMASIAVVSAQMPEDVQMAEAVDVQGAEIYLVRLSDAPLASYRGGVPGYEATNPRAAGAQKLDANSQAAVAYRDYLLARQDDFLASLAQNLNRSVEVVYQYYAANNGLALYLTAEEAAQVAKMPGVVFIQKDLERELHTDNGPEWIGAPDIWDGSATGGLPGTMGEGIIIGVIDTGINPSNPSFADVGSDGYDHTNPWGAGNYVGVCDPGNPDYDPTFPCNDKLIGAWGYSDVNGGDPRDYDGHGSHTASTAGGNFVYTATVQAPTLTITRSISGVAPHANIVAYAACCTLSALSAAIDQIVLDGVDVVNYSIGSSSPSNLWSDFDTVGYLNARDAGIFVATSAGNNGPGPDTVGSPADAPWLLSVGASTHGRSFLNVVEDMTGGNTTPPADIDGKGLTVGYGPAPIVYAGDYGDALCLNPFPPGTWSGEIVVCDRGIIARVAKGQNVLAGGAGGLVLANVAANGEGFGTLNGDSHYLPAVHIANADGLVLKNWLASGSGHMATISGVSFSDAYGDIMAGFSSRGANRAVPDIIVPSVTAPGVDIMAAYGINDAVEWNVISGTSMASPHAAGAAALLMALHPDWTPAEIQSAMMTTAWTGVMDNDNVTPADAFDMGSGRVNLTAAGMSGFVLNETTANYWGADPNIGGDPSALNIASFGDGECFGSCSWTRVITSVVDFDVTWDVMVSSHPSMTLTVSPDSFVLGPGEAQTLSVTADVSGAPTDSAWLMGDIWLVATTDYVVYLPLMAKSPAAAAGTTPAAVQAPAVPTDSDIVSNAHFPVAVYPVEPGCSFGKVDIVATDTSGSMDVSATCDLDIAEFTSESFGMVEATQDTQALIEDPTNGDPYNADGGTFFVNVTVAADDLLLVAETINSEAPDMDLYVGTGDTPSAATEVCSSTSGTADETCKIENPGDTHVGTWWILVQNWAASGSPPDNITLVYAVVDNADAGNLTVSGPTAVDAGVPFTATVAWNDPNIDGGDYYYGAFNVGTSAATPGNLGEYYVNLMRPAPDATIDVSPSLFASVQPTDTQSMRVLFIGNTGGSDLNWTITEDGSVPACDVANDMPWMSVSPDMGTTAVGDTTEVSVVFDSTGLSDGVYTGTLCIDSNDPMNPQVEVPVELTVGPADWRDSFDTYANGMDLHGVNGWKGWDNTPAATAFVSDMFANSAPHSVDIAGPSDLVHEYTATSGTWIYATRMYVPSGLSGVTYFIMLNTYADLGAKNWSVQVNFDSGTGTMTNDGGTGGQMPFVYDEWAEIRLVIDLDSDTQDFYYNGYLLYSGTWTGEVSGGGALSIQAVDLFANGASSVYYDDMYLIPVP